MKNKTVRDAVIALHGNWQNRLIIGDGWYLNQVSSLSFNGNQVCTNSEFVTEVKNMSNHDTADLYQLYLAADKTLLTKETKVDKVSCYVCHVGAYPMQQYCGSCGHELLSELIPKSSPVYTQAMADNGELPSVGMECLIKMVGHYVPAVIKYNSEHVIVYTYTNDNGPIEVCKEKCTHNIDIKPLTPPITLEDGKAYQFDSDSVGNCGIYSDEDWLFHGTGSEAVRVKDCTNIKLLTVDVKS